MRRSRATEQFGAADRELLARAAIYPGLATTAELNATRLREISHGHGIDFATALLYDRLLRDEGNREFFNVVSSGSTGLADNVSFAIIPGAFYRHHTDTGADGARIVRLIRELGGQV